MKQKSLIVAGYASLVLMGGIIGFIVANSLASILISSLFAALLFICSFLISKNNIMGYNIASGLVLCLFLFFGYRFFTSFKIFPAGIMFLVSGGVLCYLTKCKNCFKSLAHE